MKFCSKCGTQVSTDAAFCPQCGAAVEMPRQAPAEEPVRANVEPVAPLLSEKRDSVLPTVFYFISGIFVIFALFWLGFAVVNPYISGHVNRAYSSNIVSHNHDVSISFYLEEGFCILSLLSALQAGALSLVGFVLTLVKNRRTEKVLSAVLHLIFTFFLMILCIVAVGNT